MNRLRTALWISGFAAFCILCLHTGAVAQQGRVAGLRTAVAQAFGVDENSMGEFKCGTPLVAAYYRSREKVPADIRAKVAGVLQRPSMAKSRLSASGHFRVHYDTSGANTPALLGAAGERLAGTAEAYVDSVCSIFEQVWHHHCTLLGYAPPPQDGTGGGGSEYDIYVVDIGGGTFGITEWDDGTGTGVPVRYRTWIQIENDFYGYRTPGLNGLRVTAAHEFFHSIQVGSYGIWEGQPGSDFFFYELSSAWMEDETFPSINDYAMDALNLFRYFRDGAKHSYSLHYTGSSSMEAGYERAVWGIFLARRFGASVIRDIWEQMRTVPAMRATAQVLAARSTSLNEEFSQFATWLYFTGDRADTSYFPDGSLYPRFRPNITADFTGASASIAAYANPFSVQMFEFRSETDTVAAVVACGSDTAGIAPNSLLTPFECLAGTSAPSVPYQRMANGWYIGLQTGYPALVRMRAFAVHQGVTAANLDIPGPNPFVYGRHTYLRLPVAMKAGSEADVAFFTPAMQLAFKAPVSCTRDAYGACLLVPMERYQYEVHSGVYIVVATSGDSRRTWKVAIIR